MFEQETVGPSLVGTTFAGDGNNNVVDPNDAYVNALSNDEQSAYWSALYGDSGYVWDETISEAENQAAADSYYETVVETACDPLSYETATATDPFTMLYDNFGEELDALYERIESDPEVVKALAAISRCAADAGFDFVDQQSAQEDIQQRLEPVQNEMTWPTNSLDEGAWSELSDEARAKLEDQVPTLSDEGKAILADVQRYEIDMATMAYTCGYSDMSTLYERILTQHEQQFVDAHRSDLEAMRQD